MSDKRLTEIEGRLARIEKILDRLLQILEVDQSVSPPWGWNKPRAYRPSDWPYTSFDSKNSDEEL